MNKTVVKKLTMMEQLFGTKQVEKKKEKKVNNKYDYPGIINDRPHVTLLVGKKGSGKSHLCLKLLTTCWRYRYREIIFISPTFAAQFDGLWSKLDPSGITVHKELSEELINKIMKKVENAAHNTMLILDDCGEELKKMPQRTINLLVSNSRHYKLSIVCLHQKLTQSPTIIRTNTDCVIAFAACSYQQLQALWEMVSTTDRRSFVKMFAETTKDNHSFMVSIITKGGKLKFYEKDFRTELKPVLK